MFTLQLKQPSTRQMSELGGQFTPRRRESEKLGDALETRFAGNEASRAD
jgi:hypothetical protein